MSTKPHSPASMSKQVIAIDIDDVLFANGERLINAYNLRFGTNIIEQASIKDGILKGTLEILEDATQLNRDIIIDQVESVLASPEFHDISPLDESVAILNYLHKKYKLIAVSARPGIMEHQTITWLQQHYPGLFDSVYVLGARWGHGIHIDKTKLFKEQNASFVIDDLLHTVLRAQEQGIKGIVFGDYSWNQADNLPAGVTRCKDWQAVKEYFDAA